MGIEYSGVFEGCLLADRREKYPIEKRIQEEGRLNSNSTFRFTVWR